jgi:hypothetical protein
MKSEFNFNEAYHRRFGLNLLWQESDEVGEDLAAIFGKWVREYWDELKTLSGLYEGEDGASRYVERLVREGQHKYLARMSEALKWVEKAEAIKDLSQLSDKALVLWLFYDGHDSKRILLDKCLDERPGFGRKNFAAYVKQLHLAEHGLRE